MEMAKQNPDVEVLVRKVKSGKAAVIRGHYGEFLLLLFLRGPRLECHMARAWRQQLMWTLVNGRDKVICVNNMEPPEVQNKVRC